MPDELVREVVYAFHAAGVRLVLGTDSHHPGFLAGSSGLDEIEFLVAGNPLEDPAVLRTAAGVMAGGRWLDRRDLDLLMQAAILDGAW